jgi:hypothetical protein
MSTEAEATSSTCAELNDLCQLLAENVFRLVCMYVCIYIYIYIYIHERYETLYMHTYIHTCMHTHVSVTLESMHSSPPRY